MEVERTIAALCSDARHAATALAQEGRLKKDAALRAMADGVRANAREILDQNAMDIAAARLDGVSAAMLDRLALTEARLESMAIGVESIALMDDPVGQQIHEEVRPGGLRVRRVRVPIGVIALIYEARPNVTLDASALCLKAGNAIVLRGGSEAARSNAILANVISDALSHAGLPRNIVKLVPFVDREAIRTIVGQTDTIDLAIPRGGEPLIRFVTEHARVPVIQHYKGVCHLYLDGGAPLAMATAIAVNAKLSRPGVCNALECLLIDRADAERLLPPVAEALARGGCELRGCDRACALVPELQPANESDWGREYLDRVLAVRVVDGLEGALDHVARYGSGHTEAICTADEEHAQRWQRTVDAACVVVNASTRFHDGGELGLGAEIGIATSRMHWRGPMGLESLTTFKWCVEGTGQVRS